MGRLAIIFLLSFFWLSCLGQAGQTKPNIIFFFVDDMGWQETSVPFYKEVDRFPGPTKFNGPHVGMNQ